VHRLLLITGSYLTIWNRSNSCVLN